VLVFGDDGEKFGTWPGTKRHVYETGWLTRFFEALLENRDWLKVTTPAEMLENVAPLGKLYIPEGSYREMTEWALPAERINQFQDVHHHLEQLGEWEQVRPFVRGGYWRNFKVKYPETNAMYARMQMVSRRLHEAEQHGAAGDLIDQARMELYRGQCNCSYWHGAFGGVYLPHLRNAVYRCLIAADNLLDQYEGRSWRRDDDPSIELSADDYNLDGRPEVKLANNRLLLLANPADGGQIYQFDVRAICHNLQATLARRQEAYHRLVLRGPSSGDSDIASIHDRVVFKQEGLDRRLGCDAWLRNSLVDHFYPADARLDAVADGTAAELGDFLHAPFETTLRRSEGRVQLQMARRGTVCGRAFRLTKGVTLNAGQASLEVAYFFEDVPGDVSLHFAPEWNFAGLPGGAQDRFFHQGDGQSLGHLGTRIDLRRTARLGLTDQWLGIDVQLVFDRPADVWAYPVETVSQSEGGFELVHQSVAVVPHWMVTPDAYGRWSVTFRVAVDTQLAESRMGEWAEACAGR
jgi:alpha-amylase